MQIVPSKVSSTDNENDFDPVLNLMLLLTYLSMQNNINEAQKMRKITSNCYCIDF